jgi:hypothetical protein
MEKVMNKKNVLNVVFGTVCIFAAISALVFVFTGCDFPVADLLLDGKWTAVSGAQLEFASGKFTRTTVMGKIETGTYTADGSYLTFNRPGYTPETVSYILKETRLTVDVTDYYRNSPGIPENVDAIWTPYPQYGTSIIFSNGKPQKGNPKVIEGDFVNIMGSKGKYTITNRNIPGSSILTVTPTHVHGSSISTFVENYLTVNILELFDLSLIQTPYYDIAQWWFTLDEARNFFENAAGRAQTLEDQARIISALQAFFYMNEALVYDYSLEEDDDLQNDYLSVAEGKNKLTLRESDPFYGVLIYTYFKLTEDEGFWQAGPGEDPDTDPINPIDPNDPNGGWTPWQPFGICLREPFGNFKLLSKPLF